MSTRDGSDSIPPPGRPGASGELPQDTPALGDAPELAGASARREYARRREGRTKRNEQRYGRTLGRAVSHLQTPQHEQAWATGAVGEEVVARRLAKRCGPSIVVLHDRRFPGRRGNVDHIAICPTGVWVVDAKRLKGPVGAERPMFGKAKLTVAGRDQTRLVAGVQQQADRLVELIPDLDANHVTPALCFVDADFPLLGLRPLHGVQLLRPKALAARLNQDGPFDAEWISVVAGRIESHLRPASS